MVGGISVRIVKRVVRTRAGAVVKVRVRGGGSMAQVVVVC
jgi:hypothetical protein